MKIKNVVWLISAITLLAACKSSFDEINYTNGNTDFSRFVAVGSGYMAGYSDNALYYEGQTNSIPAILASRFLLAGGGAFTQPLVNPGPGVGLKGNSKYVLRLVPDLCNAVQNLKAEPFLPSGDLTNYNAIPNLIPFNNVSVPGARIQDLVSQSFGDPSLFLGNPLYSRFASNPSTSTIAGDALLLSPTFTAVWIGMDDIYNYASKGGDESLDSITKPIDFELQFRDLITQLTFQNAGAVVANIPSINTIPFFTAIPWNGLVLDAATAADLTLQYSTVDSSIKFVAGNNRFVIADGDEVTGRRQIRAGEYILLSVPMDSVRCYQWGTIVPIPERYVINDKEANSINSAVSGYNSVIAMEAASQGIALADMNTLFKNLEKGIIFNGVNLSTGYLKNSAFSTDGFYPNQKGYAILANEFLKAVNRTYSSNLPMVDINSFKGLVFP